MQLAKTSSGLNMHNFLHHKVQEAAESSNIQYGSMEVASAVRSAAHVTVAEASDVKSSCPTSIGGASILVVTLAKSDLNSIYIKQVIYTFTKLKF